MWTVLRWAAQISVSDRDIDGARGICAANRRDIGYGSAQWLKTLYERKHTNIEGTRNEPL